jgi:hypothetical protein
VCAVPSADPSPSGGIAERAAAPQGARPRRGAFCQGAAVRARRGPGRPGATPARPPRRASSRTPVVLATLTQPRGADHDNRVRRPGPRGSRGVAPLRLRGREGGGAGLEALAGLHREERGPGARVDTQGARTTARRHGARAGGRGGRHRIRSGRDRRQARPPDLDRRLPGDGGGRAAPRRRARAPERGLPGDGRPTDGSFRRRQATQGSAMERWLAGQRAAKTALVLEARL